MKFFFLGMFFVLLFVCTIEVVYCSGESDKIVFVEWVQDGDTFRTNENEWIRLADVNTPEYDENITAYWDVTNYMIEMVKNKTVYLDIDDIYTYDEKNGEKGKGDRLVCVFYVDYNQTNYLNVNKAHLETDLAEIWDHDNEFNPNSWSLYVLKENIPEFSPIIFFSTLIISTIAVIAVFRRRKFESK